MNDRLAQFLKMEGFTAVKFAEIMEVQPSSISHLLSGRNKPSFDFISRILLRFPDLNPDWIINGVGDVYKSKQEETPQKITVVTEDEITSVPSLNSSLNTLASDSQNSLFNGTTDQITDVNSSVIANDLKKESQSQDARPVDQSIERIIFFYPDGSFKEYHNKGE